MNLKRIIKVSFTMISIAAALLFLQEFVVKPWDGNDERIAGFYSEPENSLDVVFVGASEVYHDFSPCQAYRDYGILSYPFACAQNSSGTWKYLVDEIMRTQSPELIVIEINGVLYRGEPIHTEGNLRLLTNDMPYNQNTEDLINSFSDRYKKHDRLSYILPFIKYHENVFPPEQAYKRLCNRLSFMKRGYSRFKGETLKFSRMEPCEIEDLSNEMGTAELSPEYEADFRDFLQHSHDMGYPLLFIRAPHCIRKGDEKNIDRFRMTNRVEEIAGSYGYDLINFEKIQGETGIIDCEDFNTVEHLNFYGKQKFTAYFSELLKDRYLTCERPRDMKNTAKWEECCRDYEQAVMGE